jgi:two-component sensor histidine kinase
MPRYSPAFFKRGAAHPISANFGSGRCALDALVPSEATTNTPHPLQTEERELICGVPRSSQTQEPSLDAKPRQAEDEPDYLKELLAQAGIDAQASSVAAKLQEVVIGELHHRVKNTLAIVSAITSQSLKTANSLEEATKTIGERLHALGVAQDLLVRERWTGAGCRTLIEGAVKAFQSKSLDQFEIAGDNIAVSSGPAISLSMVIHELCTNAVKHGALSAPNGRVLISWAVSEDHPPRFKLHWKERGGPPVQEPSRRSFGSRLIEQALPGQLQGEARLKFEPDGLSCEVNIPLSVMQERPLAVMPSP